LASASAASAASVAWWVKRMAADSSQSILT